MASASSFNGVGFINPRQHSFNPIVDSSLFSFDSLRSTRSERCMRRRCFFTNVSAVIAKPEIDFKDPDWKRKFQEDFEQRFSLPHLKDIFGIKTRPTTFSLKSRLFRLFKLH